VAVSRFVVVVVVWLMSTGYIIGYITVDQVCMTNRATSAVPPRRFPAA